jgi:hypothetical protein
VCRLCAIDNIYCGLVLVVCDVLSIHGNTVNADRLKAWLVLSPNNAKGVHVDGLQELSMLLLLG